MDPLRDLGKLLLVVGIVLLGAGVLLVFGARLPFRLGRLPGDISYPGAARQLLFSDCDLRRGERPLDADFLDRELLPPLEP